MSGQATFRRSPQYLFAFCKTILIASRRQILDGRRVLGVVGIQRPVGHLTLQLGKRFCYDSFSFLVNSTVSYIFTLKFALLLIYAHNYNEIPPLSYSRQLYVQRYVAGNFIVDRSLGGIIAVELKLYHIR